MKNLRWLGVIAAILTLSVLPAVAQSGHRLVVNVPFAFTVGDEQFPAGRYTIESFPGASVALYDPYGFGRFVYAPSPIATASTRSFERCLVFHRFDKQYFLAEIWTSERGQKVAPGERHRQMLSSVRAEKITVAVDR